MLRALTGLLQYQEYGGVYFDIRSGEITLAVAHL